MAVTDAVLDALDLNKLQLPAGPTVVRLQAEEFFGTEGGAGLADPGRY